MAIPDSIIQGIERLDPLPITAQRLVGVLGDEEVALTRVADLIELDQAIAANIFRISRTVGFAGRMPPETLRDAVVRLGATTVLNLVLGDYLKTLRMDAAMYGLTEDELWLHAVAAQLAVKALIQEQPSAEVPPAAITAALLHDLGKLIMVRYLDADVRTIVDRCRDRNVTFVEAERQLFDTDHAEVGAAIGRKWNFPEPITDAIERHHDSPLRDPTPLLDAVVLGNLVAKTIGVGLGAEGFNLRADPQGTKRLGLDFHGFSRVCIQTSIWLKELKQVHGVAA